MLISLRSRVRSAWHAIVGNHEMFLDRTPSVFTAEQASYSMLMRAMSDDLCNRCTITFNRLSSNGKDVANALVDRGYARMVIDRDGQQTIQAWGLLSQWLIGPALMLMTMGVTTRENPRSHRYRSFDFG